MTVSTARARHWTPIALLALGILALGLLPVDTRVTAAIEEGDALAGERAYSAALDAYARAAQRCPGCPTPRLRQGNVYLQQGRMDAAWDTVLAAIRLGGLTDPALDTMGRLYAAEGAPSLATDATQRLLARYPGRADLWIRLGDALQATGDLDAARTAYLRALGVEHSEARRQNTHDRLGMLCLDEATTCAAEQFAAAAAGPDPALATSAARFVEALHTVAEGEHAAAGEAALGTALLRRGELEGACQHLQRAVDLDPDYVDGHAYLGHVLSVLGERAAATQHLEQAIALDPTYPLTTYFLGMHHLRSGAIVSARSTLERAHDLDPEDPAICAAVADTYLRDDPPNYALAERWLHAAVDRAPDDARFHLLLAHLYVDYNVDPGLRGVAVAKVAVDLAPGSAEAQETLGWAYHLGGQPGAALEPLHRARELAPENAHIRYRLGEVYRALERRAAALAAYQRAIDLDWQGPVGARAREAIAALDAPTQ
jgi:tetratricopeptide (TPR) repeat protein